MINVSPAVQMAFRVSIGVALAVLLGLLIRVQYSYWATMTVFLVMCPSWGATIQRGLTRLGMTILGCTLGGIIYLAAQHSRPLLIICFILSLFFMIYVLKTSYNWCMFYAGFFIVFLYSIITEWTYTLFFYRVVATAAGCFIAIIVSRFIFPLSSGRKYSNDLPDVLEKLKLLADDTVSGILKSEKATDNIHFFSNPEVGSIIDDVSQLKGNHLLASYESFLKKRSGVLSKKFIVILDIFIRNLSHLSRVSDEMKLNNYSYIFNEIIIDLSQGIEEKFDYIIAHLKRKEVSLPRKCVFDTKKLSELYITAKSEGATEDNLLAITAVLYHLRKMNENLMRIIET